MRVVGEKCKGVLVKKCKPFLVIEVLVARGELGVSKAFVGVEQSVSSDGIVVVGGSVGDGWEWPDVKCDALIFAGSLDSKEAQVAVL